VVPLRDGDSELKIHGTLDWLPPPDPLAWWAMSLLGALAVAALGLCPPTGRAGHHALQTLAALSAIAGAGIVAFSIGRAVDAGANGLVDLVQVLLVGQIWPLLAGLGALAAAGYALTRRAAGDFALALAGGCLALFAGVTNAAVLARAVAPVPWPATGARILITVAIAVGLGVCAAAVLRLKATPTIGTPPAVGAPPTDPGKVTP
jgi:hypothetical protein